jgi:putative peptide zinc metalloprotease protein
VERHLYRGERWYVLLDPATGRQQRANGWGWEIMARLDGTRTLGEAFQAMAARAGRRGETPPDQGTAIALLARLRAAGMLHCEGPPESFEVLERFAPVASSPRRPRFASPFYVKIPLFDPERFLTRALPFVAPLFSRVAFASWLVVVGWGVLLTGAYWESLASEGLAPILDPQRMALLLLAYPFVKAIHEFGHAFATRVWGGEVHELGVILLVFVPVPYVDASSAAVFREKHRRILVGAMGVMVELFLASLALFVWLSVGPGVLRSLAWSVMVIGGVSTLLFNGNPLLRFDGYYLLADFLEIPNLGVRANAQLSSLFQRFVLGLPERRTLAATRSERTWLVSYGLASLLYRLAVVLVIALFVADRFFLLGALLLLAVLGVQLALPSWRGLHRLRRDPRVVDARQRVVAGAVAAAAGLLLFLFALPLPSWTRSEGVLWPPEGAAVRARVDGFVERVLVAPGQEVALATTLVESADPVRTARLRVLEARLRELRARRHAERTTDLVEAEILGDAIAGAEAELAEERERAEEARIVSRTAGRLVLPGAEDLPGRFVARGEVLGYVADLRNPVVRAVIRQADVARVRGGTRRVEVRLASGEVVEATIEREVPAADAALPSPALGTAAGGSVIVNARDEEGRTAVEPVFQVDLALPADAPVAGIGERVQVRFELPWEPLGTRALRGFQRLWMGRLET